MKRFMSLALLCLLAVSGATLGFAQEALPVFCGDLTEADCAILTNATTVDATITSGTFDASFDISIDDASDAANSGTISITALGGFAIDESLVGQFSSMNMAGSFTAMDFQSIVGLLGGFDGDLNITVTIPESMVGEAGMPSSINLQLRLIDGIGYINFDTLTPILGDMGGQLPQGWGGLDLVGLLNGLYESDPAAFDQVFDQAMNSQNQMMAGLNPDLLNRFSDPAFVEQFTTITRSDDGTGTTATFETTFDFAAFAQTPEFQELMTESMSASAEMLEAGEMEDAMAMSGQILQGMTFVITQTIDTNSGYTTNLTGSFAVNGSMMMDAMESMATDEAGMMATAEAGMDSSETIPNISVTFSFDLTNQNVPPTFGVPEPVAILPYEQLLTMMGSNPNRGGMDSMATEDAMMMETPDAMMTQEMMAATPTP